MSNDQQTGEQMTAEVQSDLRYPVISIVISNGGRLHVCEKQLLWEKKYSHKDLKKAKGISWNKLIKYLEDEGHESNVDSDIIERLEKARDEEDPR